MLASVHNSFEIWSFICTQIAVAVAAGEVSIRYAGWWTILKKSDQKFTAAPLILGIAIVTGFLSLTFIQWMVTRTVMRATLHIDIPEGFYFGEFIRVGLFFGLCFLTYPVTKIHYQQAWGRAVVEMVVRVFLIGTAFLAGLECASVYHCVILHAC